ncbi:MAG: hypothetical protein WCL04_11035, partial [Verrucomicrobiota bacterium]
IRLTNAKGRSDGPEFTPDGQWIYFNSTRVADPAIADPKQLMQVWRMKPDGSGQERVTHDEFNNWFPHISPDGKWIAYISFPPDVSPEDHPYYRHCYLRLMPIGGGASKVIAYVYGGQGTINVPSWSPDSKKIAFVSNTDDVESVLTTTATTPAAGTVTLSLGWTSVAGMEATLAKHTPPGTPLADVQAFIRDRLVHPTDKLHLAPRLIDFSKAYDEMLLRGFNQPLATKFLQVYLGLHRPLLGFRSDYDALYIFGDDDRLLAVKIRRTIDGL